MKLRTTVLTARTHDVIVLGGGTAGVVAARARIDPEAVPFADLDALLRQHAAIVPEHDNRKGHYP